MDDNSVVIEDTNDENTVNDENAVTEESKINPDSVLISIKKLLGLAAENTDFDLDIIIHINSVFAILQQLGVGPDNGFYIEDDTATWADYFSEEAPHLNMVKSYVGAKVRILFDPPVSSAVMESLNRICSEFEWRANVAAENKILEEAAEG